MIANFPPVRSVRRRCRFFQSVEGAVKNLLWGNTDDVKYREQKLCLLIIVAGDKNPNLLLGRDWLQSLKLDWNTILNVRSENLDDLLKIYSSIFNPTLGTLKNF